MLWWLFVCLYNLIWMLYGVCFHVNDLICYVCTWCGWPLLKTLGDASDSVRTWSGVCPMVPGSFCLFLRCPLNPMSNEGSSLIKFIWIYISIYIYMLSWYYLSQFVKFKNPSNSIHISRDLGLCWSRSPFEPRLRSVLKDEDGSWVCGLLRHDMGSTRSNLAHIALILFFLSAACHNKDKAVSPTKGQCLESFTVNVRNN